MGFLEQTVIASNNLSCTTLFPNQTMTKQTKVMRNAINQNESEAQWHKARRQWSVWGGPYIAD